MTKPCFADIILPLAMQGRLTYRVPEEFADKIMPGMSVTVPLGSKNIYTGIVCKIHFEPPSYKNTKAILTILKDHFLINVYQLKLWEWISQYYMCSEGEVMKAALPSEIALNTFKPRYETFIQLFSAYSDSELNGFLDKICRAPKQYKVVTAYLHLAGYAEGEEIRPVSRQLLLQESGVSLAVLESLVAKKFFKTVTFPVSRLTETGDGVEPVKILSNSQMIAFNSVKNLFSEKDIVLLHGVTSSGKTEIYIHLIEEQLKKGKQVLYMLPEIALTTQIITRLKRHFGKVTGVYHSRFNEADKAEIWNKVADTNIHSGYKLILGVRSSIFLPFNSLGLIIVDEEHDSSYKQHDPSPRYHARDTAIMLAGLHQAKTLLGSASPSVESFHNARKGKYGLVQLKERFGLIKLPEIIVANTREAYRKKLMVSHFTPELLHSIDTALGKEEQVILFQNRRGFSPYIECSDCGWIPTCDQCAVSLTYHKGIGRLVCHYCGHSTALPSKCGNCGSSGMVTRGFGTEKIEDEIKIVFPSARISRMDQDTTRRKNSFEKIIRDFEERRIDILIGTQMISKGLDFENLTVVGILNADNLLNYPDFRAHERSFQLMEQVSGRAGRRQKQGKVIIQTSDPLNRIIRFVIRHDYESLFKMQTEERQTFNYPPFCRLVRINIRHRDKSQLNHFAELLGKDMKEVFGRRILGPESPVISQVQSWHIKTIMIKIEREKSPQKAKDLIRESIERLQKVPGASSIKIGIDVDPY